MGSRCKRFEGAVERREINISQKVPRMHQNS